jgi:hypothetical protein
MPDRRDPTQPPSQPRRAPPGWDAPDTRSARVVALRQSEQRLADAVEAFAKTRAGAVTRISFLPASSAGSPSARQTAGSESIPSL